MLDAVQLSAMPDTWLAMLISLALRKPRLVGAMPGDEGAVCSWKTALWVWSVSAAGTQGQRLVREARLTPSPSSGTASMCLSWGRQGLSFVRACGSGLRG